MKEFLLFGKNFTKCDQWKPGCWVNISCPDQDELDYLRNLDVPESFITDISDADERPRTEIDGDWLLTVLRVPRQTSDDDIPFNTIPVGVITNGDLVIVLCYYKNIVVNDFIKYNSAKNIEIPNKLDPFDSDAFKANPMPFYAVCTNIETGKAIHPLLENGDNNDMQYFRASASMPLVSRVVEVDGRKLLDGGITDSIPLRSMERRGYPRNVVVLTQPLGYRKKKSSMIPLVQLTMRQYPNLIKAMEVRHIRYNRQTAYVREQELAGKAFVIRPPQDLGISRTENDPAELRRVYDMGRAEMERRLPELREFLG